jgi:hypothetical protein
MKKCFMLLLEHVFNFDFVCKQIVSLGFGQILVQTPFFMVLNTGIPVLRKFMLKNLQKISFGEGQVQDPIPALPGHGSRIPAVLLGDR